MDARIRPATAADLEALGRLGAALMHTHYAFDPLRFLPPGHSAESGYAWFLGTQLRRKDVVCIRTGRMRAWPDFDGYLLKPPGINLDAAKWLCEERPGDALAIAAASVTRTISSARSFSTTRPPSAGSAGAR